MAFAGKLWPLSCLFLLACVNEMQDIGVHGVLYNSSGEVPVTNFNEPAKRTLPKSIRFFGQYYDSIYVSPDGIIGFNGNVGHSSTELWEVQQPFIAPFYYPAEKPGQASSSYDGKILISFENSAALFSLSQEAKRNVLGLNVFDAHFGIVVTWENVSKTSLEISCDPSIGATNPCKRSTFQAVILADNLHTVVIFNYEKMDITCQKFCGAGVGGGVHRDFLNVLPCKDGKCDRDHLTNLPRIKGSNVPGRFFFHVSEPTPSRGGCIDTTIPNVISHIDNYPRSAGMFGGELIDVTPPCGIDHRVIKCVFGSAPEVPVIQSMTEFTKVRCPVPRLTERGEITLSLRFEPQSNLFKALQSFTVVLPSRLLPKNIYPKSTGWNEIDIEKLGGEWSPSQLSLNQQSMVNISLVLYREDARTQKAVWKEIQLATNIHNYQNTYEIQTAKHRCQGDDCSNFEIGLFEVRLMESFLSSATNYSSLIYGPGPLGWFVKDAMTEKYGKEWPAARCREWQKADQARSPSSWIEELLPCPCTLQQVLVDFGRFQPDGPCSIFAGSKCTFHEDAIHCVRSVQPSPGGHGNQCCYSAKGLLLYAADTYKGSTPDISHDWGAAPYNKTNLVPSLPHWIHDVIPFLYCCLWDQHRSCDLYMDLRATTNCKDYKPPRTAMVYGVFHIRTFDGNTYTAGGKGDFWLLRSHHNNFRIQVHVVPLSEPGPFVYYNASVIKAVAMTADNGPLVVIRVHGDFKTSLEVTVNGQRRHFLEPRDYWQDFQGVSIVNNAGSQHNNFTIMFGTGEGVMVVGHYGLLQITVVLPPEAKGRSSALLGSWDDNPSNDFFGSSPSSSNKDKYEKNGINWGVNKTDSILPEWTMVDRGFRPTFPEDIKTIREECKNNSRCTFDAVVKQTELAGPTLKAEADIIRVQTAQRADSNCGILPVPGAVKTSNNYSLGSTVTVTSCRNGRPVLGSTTYSCARGGNAEAHWIPEVTASCKEPGSPRENLGMVIGPVVAAIAVLAIAAVIVIVIVRRRRENRPKKGKRSEDPESAGSEKKFDSVRYEAAKERERPDDDEREKL